MCQVIWVDEKPVVKVDAAGVTISYSSGDEQYARRMSRALYREMCERGLRALNQFEIDERQRRNVVRLGKRQPAHS